MTNTITQDLTFDELTKVLPTIPQGIMAAYDGPKAPDDGGYLLAKSGEIVMVCDGRPSSGIFYPAFEFSAWAVL